MREFSFPFSTRIDKEEAKQNDVEERASHYGASDVNDFAEWKKVIQYTTGSTLHP